MSIKELLFTDTPLPALCRGLDASALRQKAEAQNIANAQTPGYKRRVVNFEEKLERAMKGMHTELLCTQPGHLGGKGDIGKVRPEMALANDKVNGPGSEEMNVEREMADLAKTQLQYEAEAKLAYKHFDLLKMAIRGSK